MGPEAAGELSDKLTPTDADPALARRWSRRRLIGAAAGLAVSASLLDAFAVEPHWLAFETVEVPVKGLAPEFEGYRIGFISDLHYPYHISDAFVAAAIERTKKFGANVLLFGGDYVQSRGYHAVPALARLLAGASAPDGVYGVLGNHDHWLDGPGVRRELSQSPVRLLENQNVTITKGSASLAIAGVPDLWEGDYDLAATFKGLAPDTPRILLSHNPDLAEEFPAGHRVDLQLSGHTHGGQCRIPFGPAPIVPSRYGDKYSKGLVQAPRHPVYINRGLGLLRPMRFNCRPEVTGITLRCA